MCFPVASPGQVPATVAGAATHHENNNVKFDKCVITILFEKRQECTWPTVQNAKVAKFIKTIKVFKAIRPEASEATNPFRRG